MGRPRINGQHLPLYLQAKPRTSGRLYYYYTRDGKNIALGTDEARAIKGAARLTEAWGTGDEQYKDRSYRMLTEAEIIADALILGKICGVYFLIKDRRVDYVGQSLDVEDRLREHRQAGKAFDSYFWVACHAKDLRRLETAYIRLLDPPGNTFKPPNKVRFRNAGNGMRFLDLGALDG